MMIKRMIYIKKKLEDVANLNNQVVVNYQNELVKGLIFK